MTAFAASVGGLATPIGSAPNLIGLGLIRDVAHIDFSFLDWCAIGAPIALALFLSVAMWLAINFRAGTDQIAGGREMFLAERRKLGPWTWAQRSTLLACLVTVSLWLTPAFLAFIDGNAEFNRLFAKSFPEPIAALLGGMLLFFLPGNRGERAMSWDEASRIDWGVILLFGGGLSLGILAFQTGLAEALGQGLAAAVPTRGSLGLLIVATVVASIVTQMTSNTAAANMVVPVIIGMALKAEVDPLEPALGATMGAGLGLMLPVSTPCNAIVYSSGQIPLRSMAVTGLLLNIVAVVVIIVAVHLLTPLVR